MERSSGRKKSVSEKLHLAQQFSNARGAVQYAYNLLRCYAQTHPDKPVVVVFDIDDTLLSETRNQKKYFKLPQIVWLLQQVNKMGGQVHLITARNDDPETFRYTEEQLKLLNLHMGPQRDYLSLHLTPRHLRGSMRDVSRGKRNLRKKIAKAAGNKVTLSVGDQWTDHLRVASNKEIDRLDDKFSASFSVVRVDDDTTVWGLKLPYL